MSYPANDEPDLVRETGDSLAGLVDLAAREWPGVLGVLDAGQAGGPALTWAEVAHATHARAHQLVAAGVAPGDRVVLRMPTSAAFVVDFLAVQKAGAIAVPLAPDIPAEVTRNLVAHSGAKLLISADAAPSDLPEGVGVLGPGPGDLAAAPEPDAAAPGRAGGGLDIAVLAYTAGTTGSPRGAMLSQHALLANVAAFRQVLPPRVARDRILLASPLSNVYGLGPGLLYAMASGSSALCTHETDPRRLLRACAEYRVTVLLGVPALYAQLAELPPDEVGESLASARVLISGGAPLPPEVGAALRHATGLGVHEVYGSAQTAPALATTLTGEPGKPGSVGKPLPGIDLTLLEAGGDVAPLPLDPGDPDDVFTPEGTDTGLVAVRGDGLFAGYWPDGEHGPDEAGWLRTGEVGYLDADGDLRLLDRARDLIVVHGFNVYPHEIEATIAAVPGVREVVVVGTPTGDGGGEAVRAVVVLAAGATVTAQEIIDACAGTLASYKVPSDVRFVDELPHSPTGRVRRTEVR